MTKSRQYVHRNAEGLSSKILPASGKNAYVYYEKSARFQPATRKNFAKKGQLFNFLREENSGILSKLAYSWIADQRDAHK